MQHIAWVVKIETVLHIQYLIANINFRNHFEAALFLAVNVAVLNIWGINLEKTHFKFNFQTIIVVSRSVLEKKNRNIVILQYILVL